MRIAHEKAHELDSSGVGPGEEVDLTAKLRPVTMEDFWEARKKVGGIVGLSKHPGRVDHSFVFTTRGSGLVGGIYGFGARVEG